MDVPVVVGNNPPPPLYNPQVMDALENLKDDTSNAQRRWLIIDNSDRVTAAPVSERDATYTVGFLHALLLQERTESDSNNNNSSSRPTLRSTGLNLSGGNISDEAIACFCDFLQRTNDLSALSLGYLPPQQRHQLLTSLQINASVKALRISSRGTEDPEFGRRIASLLQHRSDFSVLDFYGHDSGFPVRHILPFIHNGLPHLRELRFCSFDYHDAEIVSIVQALLDGNHADMMEVLDLSYNRISSRSLRSLCALTPSTFTRLQKLKFRFNYELLRDLDTLRHFIREVLLAPNTTLKDLVVAHCLPQSDGPHAFTALIRALESNRMLDRLDITDQDTGDDGIREPIRDQLVESLPKMKGIRELMASWELFDEHDMELIVAAIRQNTSLYKISMQGADYALIPFAPTPVLDAIFKRNKHLNLLDELLGTATASTAGTGARTASSAGSRTATAPTIIPHGLWPRVLETVGQGGGEAGGEGAIPVFKILQARLASWPESNNHSSSNKRKRQDDATTLNS